MPANSPNFLIIQAIETGVGYGQWFHGEAVAAGMVIYTELSLSPPPSSLPLSRINTSVL